MTEYLPVSSSAHLVLVPHILGWHFPVREAFVFDVLVQLGTLIGVMAYFAQDILDIAKHMIQGLIARKPLQHPSARLGWLLGVATVPAAVGGLLFKEEIVGYFESPRAALAFLLFTAGLLTVTEFLAKKHRGQVRLKDAVGIGFAQLLAIMPGISRSGATICAGILMGLSRTAAARFSFLMSIPVMLGASLVAADDLVRYPEVLERSLGPIVVGMLVAAVTGYLVIRWFLNFLKTQSLLWFALYCALAGAIGLIWL
ncbi:MAG: undecaprenyl-diphosphate phosphatase [Deltaproteobacteria bacterium]|nr:undecaprenyl-diphosphate phosphatase [Deltaproteobacteria bacterium]